MNKLKFYKVSADTEISVLKALLREGRLYASSSSEELIENAVSSTMTRIRRIEPFCNDPYRKTIAEIWESILDIRRMRERLLFKKGKQKGRTNWYYVSNIVNYLKIRNVYNASFNKLVEMMFGDNRYGKQTENPNYKLTEDEEGLIRKILEKNRM